MEPFALARRATMLKMNLLRWLKNPKLSLVFLSFAGNSSVLGVQKVCQIIISIHNINPKSFGLSKFHIVVALLDEEIVAAMVRNLIHLPGDFQLISTRA